ncbi:MAG: DUF3090 family protein [Acidimicrobiia bacterium]
MTSSFEFIHPDAFTVGALGRPGERVFYIQVVVDQGVYNFKLEKIQVRSMAEYFSFMLEEAEFPVNYAHPAPELVEPVDPEWTVTAASIGIDLENELFTLVLHSGDVSVLAEDTEEAFRAFEAQVETDPQARIQISFAQAASFIHRNETLAAQGRPVCIFCGLPINVDGHFCPREN